MFERTVLRQRWRRLKWASLQAPFLSGNAQQGYWDHNNKEVANYDCLKWEILSRYGYSLAHRAQLFPNWRFVDNASPQAQMSDLLRITRA